MLMEDKTKPANLTIGQFGRLAQLSRKALRLYDQRGLLLPTRTDPDSGYRYYGRDQVAVARRIRQLRSMGMALDRVGEVLAARYADPVAPLGSFGPSSAAPKSNWRPARLSPGCSWANWRATRKLRRNLT